MMKFHILFLLSLLGLASIPANAANWKFVGPAAYHSRDYYVFYDPSTYKESNHGRFVTIWVKFVDRQLVDSIWDTQRDSINEIFASKIASGQYPPDTSSVFWTVAQLEIIATDFRPATRLMIHEQIDCGGRKNRTLSSILYDDDGEVMTTDSTPHAQWDDIAPETFGDLIMRVMCRRHK